MPDFSSGSAEKCSFLYRMFSQLEFLPIFSITTYGSMKLHELMFSDHVPQSSCAVIYLPCASQQGMILEKQQQTSMQHTNRGAIARTE